MIMMPYSSAIGSLMHTTMRTRSNITHAVGVVSIYLSNPSKEHWNIVKWILRYLRGIFKISFYFESGKPQLIDYTDVHIARDIDFKKSTFGYLITFLGRAISWQLKLQKYIDLLTTKVEFIIAI